MFGCVRVALSNSKSPLFAAVNVLNDMLSYVTSVFPEFDYFSVAGANYVGYCFNRLFQLDNAPVPDILPCPPW